MTIKLITSQAYVDNIKNFLPEKTNSKSSSSQKADKLFDKIINSPNIIFDKNDKRITDDIKTLISIRPGRTLFKRLLGANQLLKIVFDSEENTNECYDPRTKESTITLNDSKAEHTISVNSDGERFFSPALPGFIILVHELIHALHNFEEGKEMVDKKRKNKNILAPDLDDLEEQETIIGKEGEGTFCENVFNFHFGYPLRINHRAIMLNKENTFTATDCAAMGVVGILNKMLLSNPSLLNLPQLTSNDLQSTPLNASIAYREVEMFDYLLQIDADVNAQDDVGTALHMAIMTKQLDLAKVLLEKGASVDVKNSKGLTPLEMAIKTKQPDLAKVLLEKGASVDVKNSEGLTPLGVALIYGNKETIELLTPLSNLDEINKRWEYIWKSKSFEEKKFVLHWSKKNRPKI